MSEVAPFIIAHTFLAPPALVYAVHTQPDHLAEWLSPEGFQSIHAAMDLRVGGTYHYGLEGPAGMQMWGLQTFREIVPGEKLVYLQSFSDKDGGLTRHPMAPTWPLKMLATTTFEDAGPGKTKYTARVVHWTREDCEAHDKMGFHQGWGIATDQMTALAKTL